MVKYFQQMLKALNSNRAPGELAHAFALGMLLAFVPKGNLLWFLLFAATFFLRINRGTLFLSIILGAVFVPLLDGCFDASGYAILTSPALAGIFAKALQVPFVAFTRFNNSVVMGALVWGIAAYVPFYLLARLFVKVWRRTLYKIFISSRVYRFFVRIPFIQIMIKALEAKHD